MNVLSLCAEHHQTGGIDAPSLHPWVSRFEKKYGTQAELLRMCIVILARHENTNVTQALCLERTNMNHETPLAQGRVDVNVRPSAWAVKQRDCDDDRDDIWAGIYCNPDTAREDADALEATSTDRFDVVPVWELTEAQRDALIPAVPALAVAQNVFAFPATTTMTPEQALRSALEFAINDNMQDVLVVGYDGDGVLVVRSSRMDRKEALWLAEQLRKYALGDDVTEHC